MLLVTYLFLLILDNLLVLVDFATNRLTVTKTAQQTGKPANPYMHASKKHE